MIIQIQIIKNCKGKIFIKTIAYARLVINFFKNDFWQENKQILKQYIKLIKLFLVDT